jgi:putative holliday junction resolvase
MPATPEGAGEMDTGTQRGLTLLAFDYGRRRTGVATGGTLAGLTRAVATLGNVDQGPDWRAIDALIHEWRPDLLVVGLPYNADGSPSPMTAQARSFAAALGDRSGLPVELVDERLSSLEAATRLREERASGRRRRLQRGDIDREAARLLAEQWLNEHSRGG